MRFSYNLIKNLAPGKYDEDLLAEKLNLISFETANLGAGILDIAVAPNRFSDAASYLGIAREVAAIFGCKFNDPTLKPLKFDIKTSGPLFVKIQDKNLCGRYAGTYVSDVKVGSSPQWLKDVLEASGFRSVNNIVDIINYATLETGQPLHAFDADKLQGGIVVRKAKSGEKIETIDGGKFALNKDILVIADKKRALAIAGIKGGKFSEVSSATKRILVEAASFDGVNIYKSSRQLSLATDASVRFSHGLSPLLVESGMNRALALLKELAHARIYKTIDVYPRKQAKKLMKIDLEKINKIIGQEFKMGQVVKLLRSLGFAPAAGGKLWLVPALRLDINDIEDVAEEAARFNGYNQLLSRPPTIAMKVAEEDEEVVFRDKMRRFLQAASLSEVYNYSFLSPEEIKKAPTGIFGNTKPIPLLNPISGQFSFLRDSLGPGLVKNLEDNLRFSENIKIFEIGKIFGEDKGGPKESLVLGIAVAGKDSFLEIKGAIDELFDKLGITDYLMPDLNSSSSLVRAAEALRIETDEHQVLGYLGVLDSVKNGAMAEINLEKLLREVNEEREFEALPKYPAIVRDLSIWVRKAVRVTSILNLIYSVSPKLIEDVDLIDYYADERMGLDRRSLTFRIVFRAEDRTLTDHEVDKEMAIINKILADRFDAEIR